MFKLNKKNCFILGFALFGVLLMILYMTKALDFFSLQNLKLHRQDLLNFVDQHYFLAVLLYLIFTILMIATALPLAAFVMILAGLLFGFKLGLIYSNIGSTIGACISFIWLRYAFGQAVPGNLRIKLEDFSKKIDQYGSLYFLSLHLMSLLPFFIINSLAVLAQISMFTFTWTTSLGIVPISILYVYIGQKLCQINSISEVLTIPVMLIFCLLAFIAILPALIDKIKKFI